jgi:hypothetical protein
MATLAPMKAFHHARWYCVRAQALGVAFLFVIGAFVYGVFIPSLGFYWDDWPMVWVYNAFGLRGLAKYWAAERPAVGWLYAMAAPALGISPVGWHVVSLTVRCASSAVLFLTFSAVWPRRKDAAWLLGVLVLLYPGFTQQPIALTYLPHHVSFFLFVLSLMFTVLSITRPVYRWLLLPLALTTEGLSYVIIEYFVGLELLRVVLIGVVSDRQRTLGSLKAKVTAALISWSPYAAVWIGYIVWRAVFMQAGPAESYKNVGSDVSRILSSPLHAAAGRVFDGIHNVCMATVFAWTRPFSPDLIMFSSGSVILAWAVGAIVALIAIYMLRRLAGVSWSQPQPESTDNRLDNISQSCFLLGAAALFVAGLPLAVSGVRAVFGTQPAFADRFTLPFMLAASLILLGVFAVLGRTRRASEMVVALALCAFSVYQVENGNLYRRDWLTQKSIFWQLAWRAPVLKQGTSIFVDGLPRSIYGNHTAGILNLLYNRDDSAGHLDYFMFDLPDLTANRLPWAGVALSYRPGAPIAGRVRFFHFESTTAQSLIAWISPTGTLRIVTPRRVGEILRGSALCFNLSQLSQPEGVISDAPTLPDGPLHKILGAEPKHEWLYFYQRAELERQLGKWDAVAELGDEATKQSLTPRDPSEWFPFVDAYTRIHRYQTAANISIAMLKESPDAMASLSSLWVRVKREDAQNSLDLQNALGALGDKLVLVDWQ